MNFSMKRWKNSTQNRQGVIGRLQTIRSISVTVDRRKNYVIGDLFFIYVRRDYRAVVVVQITLADTAAQGSFYDNIISYILIPHSGKRLFANCRRSGIYIEACTAGKRCAAPKNSAGAEFASVTLGKSNAKTLPTAE